MTTRRRGHKAPKGYDPSEHPQFAVTVDVVILTIVDEQLHVVLVRRRDDPYKGMWALPGGFKRPDETLKDAASRELREETGVEAADYLSEFGAYGDPGRDPRMNVVTIGFLAVLRDVGELAGGERRGRRSVGACRRGDQRRRRARVRSRADLARRSRAGSPRPRDDEPGQSVRRADVHAEEPAQRVRGSVGDRARRGELPPHDDALAGAREADGHASARRASGAASPPRSSCSGPTFAARAATSTAARAERGGRRERLRSAWPNPSLPPARPRPRRGTPDRTRGRASSRGRR